MKAPAATYLADTYRFAWEDVRIHVLMDRLHEARGGDLTGEVEIRCSRDRPNELLHMAKLNLVSTPARKTLERALADRIPSSEMDWGAILEQACHLAIKHWREGDPVVDLRDVPAREGTRFLLEPYVEHAGAAVLFADGGSGKSFFGLAIAASIASGYATVGAMPSAPQRVLYLDWESDAETHADRLRAICAGSGFAPYEAPVFYRRQSASLAEASGHIRRLIAEEEIGFVVIDSLGAARGGEPESAADTLRLFNAARSLEVPWLAIDHVTKNGGDGQAKPFGSVYTHNMARLTWGMEKVEDYGDGRLILALMNHKTNNGLSLGRRAYEAEFRNDPELRPIYARYQCRDTRDVPSLFGKLKQHEQITVVLRKNRGPMLVRDITRCLEEAGVKATPESIRVVLNRYKQLFVGIPGSVGEETRWGLAAREESGS